MATREHNGSSVTAAVEDYAKAIYALETHTGGPVSTNALAERLGVTAASASNMAKKLDQLGLVEHVPYKGVKLTPAGLKVALEVLRHHRLLELYLAETLDVPWDRVHDEAEVLEHVLSEELEELIARKLGHPTHDPHGDALLTRDLKLGGGETEGRGAPEPGGRGLVGGLWDCGWGRLRRLRGEGAGHGVGLVGVGKQPFDGPVSARVGMVVLV